MEKSKPKKYLNLFKGSWKIFVASHPTEFASSFAYFSLFGLPSIFLIIIFILSFFFNTPLLYDELGEQLRNVVGKDSADIMVTITKNYQEKTLKNIWHVIFYSITVFLLATQLIIFFQDILNHMWQVKPKFKNFWQKQIKERGLTFLMVLITGLLFFASVIVERLMLLITGEINGITDTVVNVITIALVYLWFAILYKFLPFVNIQWQPTLVGAAVTTVLFFIGAWLLWEFAVKDNSLEELYDYVASIVLISFWIFYNSLAFLFGAAFTKAYAEMKGKTIKSKPYAFQYKIVEKE